MKLNPKIFRAYDIRGKFGTDFDAVGFFAVARAFACHESAKFGGEKLKIFVSGDGRLSHAELFPAVIAGLLAEGCEVVFGGTIPTPINFFAREDGDFDAAIQISASHNPATDNGLKLSDRRGSVCGAEIQKVRKITEKLKTATNFVAPERFPETDFTKKYAEKLQKITPPQKPKKIVVDAGNGIAGVFYPEIFRKFGHEVIELFCDLDGNFPNHQPDPERPENLKNLVEKVAETDADFGFAFDGDGDRAGIVLKSGEILGADKILFALATDFLSRNPGEKIVVDAMSSQILIERLKKIDAKVIVSPTGHSFIEENMKKFHAKFGGEQSGHFMFGENFYGHDDAMLASLRFLGAVERDENLISEITKKWEKFHEFSEKLPAGDDQKFEILEKFTEKILKKYPDATTTDGVRMNFGNGEWAIVRCSNTSPKIAVRIEARDEKSLAEKKNEILGILGEFLTPED